MIPATCNLFKLASLFLLPPSPFSACLHSFIRLLFITLDQFFEGAISKSELILFKTDPGFPPNGIPISFL